MFRPFRDHIKPRFNRRFSAWKRESLNVKVEIEEDASLNTTSLSLKDKDENIGLSSESCESSSDASRDDLENLQSKHSKDKNNNNSINHEQLENDPNNDQSSPTSLPPPLLSSSSSVLFSSSSPSSEEETQSSKVEEEPKHQTSLEDDDEESDETHPKLILKGVKEKGTTIFDKLSHAIHSVGDAVGSKLNQIEDFAFPRNPQFRNYSHNGSLGDQGIGFAPRVRGGVLLRGCLDEEDHRHRIRTMLEVVRPLKGEEGLKALGFQYEITPLHDDKQDDSKNSECEDEETSKQESPVTGNEQNYATTAPTDKMQDKESILCEEDCFEEGRIMTRLFYANSNTIITAENRKEFIADGDMYNAVARLCQEYAQEIMIQEGDLEWMTVSEAGNNEEPIRALVSKSIADDESNLDRTPTLLIATGRGKVRAGIFSRQHLLISGIECSTALPIVREAKKRQMNVVMLDPNVHGDRLGMVTFEKSMSRLFRRWEEGETCCSSEEPPLANRDLYVLSHSQSGAQFARYLLEKSQHYLPHIRAVAFTDSTHNIQWTRENQDLNRLLQSENCAYWRVSKQPSKPLVPLQTLGEEVETDPSWQSRFGSISTRCAGTSEHSLTNWSARYQIWQHFDTFSDEKP